jgi:hypothetical protein
MLCQGVWGLLLRLQHLYDGVSNLSLQIKMLNLSFFLDSVYPVHRCEAASQI